MIEEPLVTANPRHMVVGVFGLIHKIDLDLVSHQEAQSLNSFVCSGAPWRGRDVVETFAVFIHTAPFLIECDAWFGAEIG